MRRQFACRGGWCHLRRSPLRSGSGARPAFESGFSRGHDSRRKATDRHRDSQGAPDHVSGRAAAVAPNLNVDVKLGYGSGRCGSRCCWTSVIGIWPSIPGGRSMPIQPRSSTCTTAGPDRTTPAGADPRYDAFLAAANAAPSRDRRMAVSRMRAVSTDCDAPDSVNFSGSIRHS